MITSEQTKILLYNLIEDGDEKLVTLLYSLGLEYVRIHYEYTKEFLEELEKRRADSLTGQFEGCTFEEAKERIVLKLTGKSTAKNKLYRVIRDADEETVKNLLELIEAVQNPTSPFAEDIAKYEQRSENFIASGEKGISKKESLQLLRKKME